MSFERSVFAGMDGTGPTTEDYLVAITESRPSVTDEVRASFEKDVEELARL